MKDKVIVPNDLPVGEYVLSWRWDCYMADQIWSNCADVEITNSPGSQTTTVASSTATTTTESTTSSTSASTSSSGCVDGELPTEWSQSGRFDCNYFRERGAAYTNPLAYCAHAAIRDTCCFCQSSLRQRRALRRGNRGNRGNHGMLALIQNATGTKVSKVTKVKSGDTVGDTEL